MIRWYVFFALILGAFVGGVAGYLGSLMTSKRMALVGGAFGHLALPGVSLALAYNFDITIGALLFLAFGASLIWFLHYKTHLPFEALTGVVFAVSVAVSFLIVPQQEIDVALFGDISQLTPLWVLGGCMASFIIFLLVRTVYNHLVLGMISEEIALVNHINLRLTNLVYLLSIGFVVALGVRFVGGLMTAALVTIPAAISSNISLSLQQYAYLSLLFGALSCCCGVLLNVLTGLPIGPLIVVAGGIFFLISLMVQVQRS